MKLTLRLPSGSQSDACLLISGELDRTVLVHDYWVSLTTQDKKELVKVGKFSVDLNDVERADTAGLAWLINIVKDAQANKVEVVFVNVPSKLLNLAELSSADTILVG